LQKTAWGIQQINPPGIMAADRDRSEILPNPVRRGLAGNALIGPYAGKL
jgi:hypothetical protein